MVKTEYMSEELLTVVLYTKNDALKFLRDKPHVGRVYPLTLDARAELIGNTDLPILDPLDYFNDYGHLRVLARVRRMETILNPLIYNEKKLSDAAKETFRSMFHLLACQTFYLFYLIRDVGPWSINYGNSWYRCTELTVAHKMLSSKIFKGLWGSFSPPIIRTSLIHGLYRFFNRIIISFLNGKQCIWTTGKRAGMKDLVKYLKDNNSSVYILSGSRFHKRWFYRYFMQVIKVIFKKKKEIEIIIPSSSINPQILGILNNALNEIRDSIFDDVKEVISPFLASTIGYTESLTAYTNYYYKKVTSLGFITDNLRWLEAAVCGEAAKINNVRSILIPQGLGPYLTDTVSLYAHHALAHGLLVSPLADETVVQTPNSNVVASKYMPELKRRKFQPMMFGYKKIKKANNKNKIRTILHASTHKILAARPWIYETSNEFLKGLQILVEAVSDLENTRLVIRVRPNLECSVSSLKKLLPITGNIEIKSAKADGSFFDDLECANLLISFSSTTIDETLLARKPVGLFGGSMRYRYLPGSSIPPTVNERHAVYHLQKENLSTMLSAILDSHKNNPLTDKELEGYVWPSSVPGRDEFINDVLYHRKKKVSC